MTKVPMLDVKLSPPQMLSAGLAVVFTVLLAVVSWCSNEPSATVVIVLGILIIFSLLVTVVDPSRFHEFSANLKEGGISFKATPENVARTIKANDEQEKLDTKDSKDDGVATTTTTSSLAPLVEEARDKDPALRTDADYLALATDAWRAKRLDTALRFAYAGLERPPSAASITAALYSRLGTINDELSLYEQAERDYRHAISINPNYAVAFSNLGALLADTDRLSEAEAAYREALRLKPDYASAHYNLGTLLSKFDKLPEAEAAYREALRLEPNYGPAHNNLGNLLVNLGRLPEAEVAFRDALRLEPENAKAHNNLGALFAMTNRMPEAEAAFREALRLDPEFAEAQNNLKDIQQRMAQAAAGAKGKDKK